MVEALGNIQLAARAIASGDGTSSIHPIDARYRELHTCLQPIDTGSPTHRLLQDYLANTHASTHNSYKLELQQAFSVEREGEEAAFRDVGNRQLLFHGSRLTNWAVCAIGMEGHGHEVYRCSESCSDVRINPHPCGAKSTWYSTW